MNAMLKVLVLSLAGGYLFSRLHIPIPWMLGPIVFVMLVQFVYKGPLGWSGKLRDIGIVMVAVMIGVQFDIGLFGMLGSLLLYMLSLNLILIGGSIGIAFLVSRWVNIPTKAALLGLIPGGLGQILIFAEEERIQEIGIITYLQVIRLLLVVAVVPFIVAGQTAGSAQDDAPLTVSLVLLMAAAWGCGYFAKRLGMPVAFFITPIIFLIVLQLTTPLAMPEVPGIVMITAQLLIGAHIGLMLKPHMVKLPVRVLAAGIASALALILLTFGSGVLMSFTLDTSFATSFLSTAPGGLDQMVLLAEAIKADVSLVSMFQTFRLMFIFILIMPLLKLFYRRREKKRAVIQ